MSNSTTEMLMFRVSSTSSSSVGSGTMSIPMMATTTTARTMSEYLERKPLLWADMRPAILARPRLFPKPPPHQGLVMLGPSRSGRA
ncbi:hypothetical protein ACN28S_08315 [Cystobacter fuscus]